MRIADFRKLLDEWEAKWTEEDTKYMGEYGDQEIVVPVFQLKDDHRFEYRGLGKDLLVYWDVTGLGVVIDYKEV